MGSSARHARCRILESGDVATRLRLQNEFRMPVNEQLGRAMLAGSDLTGCKLSGAWLRRANLRGVVASGADLREAVLATRSRVRPT